MSRTFFIKNATALGAIVSALLVTSSLEAQIVANWLPAGSGDYGNPANWDVGVVPLNVGGTTFIVNIPSGAAATISLATLGAWTVDELYLGLNRTLVIGAGTTLSTPNAEVLGCIDAEGGDFIANQTATFPGTGATVHASLGSLVQLLAPLYSSVGLVATCCASAVDYTWNLLTATDPGTLLDLSSLQEIDAGFGPLGNDYNRHEISVSNGAEIDLSGLVQITGPPSGFANSDWIRFSLNDPDATLRLDSLVSVLNAGAYGATKLESHGAPLDLPSLQSIRNVHFTLDGGAMVTIGNPAQSSGGLSILENCRFFLSEGATLIDDGTPATYSSLDLTASCCASAVDYTSQLMTATDPGTLLDLSSLQEIDAGFGPLGNDYNRHEISASNGAFLDLSGAQLLTKPSGSSDWIRFTVNGGPDGPAFIDLSALQLIEGTGSGQAIFDVLDGDLIIGSLTQTGRTTVNVDALGNMQVLGSLSPAALTTVTAEVSSNIEILGDIAPTASTTINSAGSISVGGDVVGSGSFLSFLTTEGDLTIGGSLHFENTDELQLPFETIEVTFDGSGAQSLEVGGLDVGTSTVILANGNFGMGRLVVGTPGNPTTVNLVDMVDNGNTGGGSPEALYLWGLNGQDGIEIATGSTLCLGTLNAYALIGGVWEHLNNMISLNPQPALGGGILCGTPPQIEFDRSDANADGFFNIADATTD